MIRKIAATAAACLVAFPACAQETVALVSAWNPAVQLTAERDARRPTADVASPAWVSADWVLEPAPTSYGADAFYMKNRWRNTYLTFIYEFDTSDTTQPDSNVQLRPKITDPTGPREQVLAQGQVWKFEPLPMLPSLARIPNQPNFMRIRTAYPGFGLSYLTIGEQYDGKLSFREPAVSTQNTIDRAAIWYRVKSSYTDQQQCVTNNSWTVVDIDWYLGRDLALVSMDGNLVTIPKAQAKAQLTERKLLGQKSCENSNQRMAATVRLVGKEEVDGFVSTSVTFISTATGFFLGGGLAGGGAAYFGSNELMHKYLINKPNTVYTGVPGKITLTGTLYDATATANEPLGR